MDTDFRCHGFYIVSWILHLAIKLNNMLYMNDMSYNNITHTATDISSITAKKDSCDNIE